MSSAGATGGVTGIDLAIHHPERVKALAVYGAHISPEGFDDEWAAFIRDTPMAEWEKGWGPAYRADAPDPGHLKTAIEKIKTMWLTEPKFTAAKLASIKVPTLVLDGQQVKIIREGHAKAIADVIPGAGLILLPDPGHNGPGTRSSEFNRIVLDFLKDK